jgi:hypothetical protein
VAKKGKSHGPGCIGTIAILIVLALWLSPDKQKEPPNNETTEQSSQPAVLKQSPMPRAAPEKKTKMQVADFKINVQEIAGKSPTAVEKILGKPFSEEIVKHKGKSLPKKSYDNGDIEIVYVNRVADWITVYGHGQLRYDQSALAQLGLDNLAPTFSNPIATIRWSNQPGLKEVSLFPGERSRAFYAYILVNTSP